MKRIILYVLLILAFCSIVTFLYFKWEGKKIAYIDLTKINSEFDMKKDLENRYKETVSIRTKILDSLKLEVLMLQKALENKKDEELYYRYNVKKEEYLRKEEEFNTTNNDLSGKYSSDVWNQLNQYVTEYGKANGYDYIFGAAGNGSLMYANQNEDITNDVVKFVNLKYHDKK